MNNGNFMTRSSFRKFRNKIIKKLKLQLMNFVTKVKDCSLKRGKSDLRLICFATHMLLIYITREWI